MKKYLINDREFYQTKLVWGELELLTNEFESLDLSFLNEISDIASVFSKKTPRICAIILREEGKEKDEKSIDETHKWLKFNLDLDLGVEIIEDFFEINSPTSLLEKVNNLIQKVVGQIQKEALESTSEKQLSSSVEETSQKEK